jgi:hypothetical protein
VLTRYCVVPHVGLYYGAVPPGSSLLTLTNLSDRDVAFTADGATLCALSPRATATQPAAGYRQIVGTQPFRLEANGSVADGPSI